MKFQNPPAISKTVGRPRFAHPSIITAAEAARLKAKPGRWALVAESADRADYHAVHQWAAYPARRGEWSVTRRVNGDGVDIYLRWNGEQA